MVPAADFQDNPKHGRVEIILKNADKISVEEGQSLLFDLAQNVLLIQKDSSTSKIDFENIREVKEEKLNIQKTFFSTLWLGGLSLVALGLILIAFVHPGKMS